MTLEHMCVLSFSHVLLFETPWAIACQAPLSMGFSRQEYWSGLPFSPPGDLPDPRIQPTSPVSPALLTDSLPLSHLRLGWNERKKVKSLSHVRFFVTPWTVTCQAPLSMGFSRQEYWSGLPFPPPEDLPNPGIEPGSPALQADALPSEPPGKAGVHIL